MLSDAELCEFYGIDEDDIGRIEDVRFLLKVISLLHEGINPEAHIENCFHKLRMISSRLHNEKVSHALLELLYKSMAEPAKAIVVCQNSDLLYQPHASDEDIVEEAAYELVDAALSRFPKMYIAKAKLHMKVGEYMPGDPLMLAFGQALVVQFNEWQESEKILGRQISPSNPTIVWDYQWCKTGHWLVNVVMFLNLDVYREPGRFSSTASLAHRVRNAWACALSVSTIEAQDLIEFDTEEFMHRISGADSVINGEIFSEEDSEDAPYFFIPQNSRSYEYNFPLNGAAYFE